MKMNNDRFKFRVWDLELKRYLLSDDGGYVITTDGELLDICCERYNLEGDLYEKCIIQMCAALKDINGKLIYEGDILRHNDEGSYLIKIIFDNNFSANVAIHDRGTIKIINQAVLNYYMIIGNNMENSDLLKYSEPQNK